MTTPDELRSTTIPDWCPGCGDHAILMAVKGAIADAGLEPHKTLIVSGIGCSSKLPHYVKTYGYHGIHGRPLPLATAMRLANHEMNIIVISGDGDCYGIGMCHFVHAIRRNVNLTLLVHDNQIYGLTTGQASPTSDPGMKTKTSPFGVVEASVRPLMISLASGGSFVARGFAGNPRHLRNLIVEGIKHKGLAHIDIMQPCVTFNRVNTFEWYRQRAYDLGQTAHDPSNWDAAMTKAAEWGDKIPIGILYRHERPTYEEMMPALQAGPLFKQTLERDIRPLMDRFV